MISVRKNAIVRSFAKVNLTLDILGTRSDGYHDLESVMQTISLHDTVRLSVGEGDGIRLVCDMPGIPTDERNLAHRAASLLFAATGIAPGLDIRIEKRIPVEAGLGGGSSNAAAVLIGLDRLLGLATPVDEMCDLAAQIGSDVPFFLIGGTAFVSGRGERVRPLPDIPPMWMVIVKPPFGVSTAWSYRRLDEIRATNDQSTVNSERKTASQRMVECMQSGKPQSAVCGSLSNDLELPAIEQHPEIAEIKTALIGFGAQAALMCGSGSAVCGLFETEEQAVLCGRRLQSAMASPDRRPESPPTKHGANQVFVTRTITRGEALSIE